MLVLDENLPAGQQQLLRKWRLRFRFVGMDVAASGAEDENLIPILHSLPHPTFFTLDRDFYRRDWMHLNYSLVWLDVRRREAAEFIRRFLRHPAFDTQAKRMGIVASLCGRSDLLASATAISPVALVAREMNAPSLTSLQRGDADAWDDAFRWLWPTVFAVAQLKLQPYCPNEVEDVAIEALEEMVEKVRVIKSAEELKPLAASIAHHRAVSLLRERFAKNHNTLCNIFFYFFDPNQSTLFIFAGRTPNLRRAYKGHVENRALGNAIRAFQQRAEPDDDSALLTFLKKYPDSVWRVGLLTDLGLMYRRSGYFCKALEAWEEAWNSGKRDTNYLPAAIVDRAVAELAELNARLGRYDRLEKLLSEIEGRDVRGSPHQKIVSAREGLWLMDNRPEVAFRCGPMALDRIRTFLNPADALCKEIRESCSTRQGFALVQVQELARKLKMSLRMARREPGAPVLVPSVVHWKAGHFAALIKEESGRYLVQDPTFGDDIWVTKAALDAEASGYFLVPTDPQESAKVAKKACEGDSDRLEAYPPGWQRVSAEEGAKIFGKGATGANDPNATRSEDKKVPDRNREKEKKKPCPMAVYAFHLMAVNLNIEDTPK